MSLRPITPTAAVTAAVQLASARTGVDFGYLMTQAKLESRFDPNAAAATSSARGLFQFTQGTWLDTVRKHGSEQGLSWAAAAIADGSAARDPEMHAAILNLRLDPQASALMAGAHAADNAATLTARLGRPATPADLYMAHFLGSEGALRFLTAKAADPDAVASSVAPAAAQANPGVFFANGNSRSLAAVYDRFAAKFGGNSVPPPGSALPVQQAAASAPAARMAYLLLAELGA